MAVHADTMHVATEQSLTRFLEAPTRFLFFTGTGGVGKTSLACASAIALADGGRRVLRVSTDPASNLVEALGVCLTSIPTDITPVPQLAALNTDPAAAAAAYREKLVGPYRGQLPAAILQSLEEPLSGACTMEIAAFDEFSKRLGEPAATANFDHVLFDTAPTGPTLRLLSLPGAWTGFLASRTTGNSCLGPLAGLKQQRVIYENAVASLADGARTTLVLVSRAQRAALAEAECASDELAALGVRHQRLILNGLFQAADSDPVALALEGRGANALTASATFLARLLITTVPQQGSNLLGLPALRALVRNGNSVAQVSKPAGSPATKSAGRGQFEAPGNVHDNAGLETRDPADLEVCAALETLPELVDDLAPTGHTLLVLDATESYHREVARKTSDMPDEVRQLLPRLRDGDFTRVLVVTLPEATPVHEAAALQTDLRRAQIEPFAWVIHQSFAESGSHDPLLVARGADELPYLREVVKQHTKRTAIVPWVTEEPIEPEKLRQLFQTSTLNWTKLSMTTYVSEIIPSTSAENPRYFELKQSMNEAALTKHPETGEPIRRVMLGGFGVLSSKASSGNAGSSCGPSCGCH